MRRNLKEVGKVIRTMRMMIRPAGNRDYSKCMGVDILTTGRFRAMIETDVAQQMLPNGTEESNAAKM